MTNNYKRIYCKHGYIAIIKIMIIQNINNQMNAMLEALKPSTPDINLSGREHELAMKEASKQAFILQRETEEINMDNRIFDAQN